MEEVTCSKCGGSQTIGDELCPKCGGVGSDLPDVADKLQEEIAKAQGYKKHRRGYKGQLYGIWPDGTYGFIPDWPRDIGAAMELWDEMGEDPDGDWSKLQWWHASEGDYWEFVHDFENVYGRGDTREEAICRAYLEWVKGE